MAIIIPHQLSLAPHLSPLPFSADRFPIHSGPLFCFQQSSLPFPSVCYPVSFGPHLRSLSVRSSVPFVSLLRFFRSALSFSSVRFLFLLVRFYEALCRSQVFSLLVLFTLLSGIFVPLKSDTRLSTFETTPFSVRDNALLAPRTRPSTFKNTPFSSRLRMCLVSC